MSQNLFTKEETRARVLTALTNAAERAALALTQERGAAESGEVRHLFKAAEALNAAYYGNDYLPFLKLWLGHVLEASVRKHFPPLG